MDTVYIILGLISFIIVLFLLIVIYLGVLYILTLLKNKLSKYELYDTLCEILYKVINIMAYVFFGVIVSVWLLGILYKVGEKILNLIK